MLCFFNPNFSVAFITPSDLLLLKLHPDTEVGYHSVVLSVVPCSPKSNKVFFFFHFFVFDYLPF